MKEEKLIDSLDPIAKKILTKKEYFEQTSKKVRSTWIECFKAYSSWVDSTKNPFLANLFIPKTHEAVELLAAFLVGPNQSILASAEGKDDTKKALLVGKWLDYMWRKTIHARDKVLVWVKQSILFGNGIVKVVWDSEKNEVDVIPVSLPDVYFNYFDRDSHKKEIIHRIVKKKDDIVNDDKYNSKRKLVVSMGDLSQDEKNSRFDTYDNTTNIAPSDDVVELFEHWTLEKVTTIAQTSKDGFSVLREIENPYEDCDGKKFIPFVKVRFKTNPLPNRAYDLGAVEPTLKLQLAFNDMMNEVFDNVSLINNKMWIKRRGSSINPQSIVRRPGGIIEVDDIEKDIKSEEVSDIKQSAIEVLNMLDNEFQQSSMVVNILKGVPGAEFATEVAAGQANVQTLLSMIDQNIKDALSELGQMVLEIALTHIHKIDSIKVIDTDTQDVFISDVPADEIKGKYDIRISADRSYLISQAVKQKQMLDLLAIISKDMITLQRYPDLLTKIYKKWLEAGGESDLAYFFEEQPTQQPMQPQTISGASTTPSYQLPQRGALNTPQAIDQSVQQVPMPRV